MKLPSWYTVRITGAHKGYAFCEVHIRKWHPGFWLYALRMLWRSSRGK